MDIAEALQSYLISSNLHESSGKEKKFYLSDMGKCMRMRFFKRKGVETEFEPYVNWILQMGNLYHDFGYKALESQGLLLEAEDYVKSEHFIGRYDGVIKYNDTKAPFDFKSIGAYKLKKIMAGEEDEDNIAQVLSYTMFLREIRKDIGDTSFVVYINKEPSDKLPVAFFQREYHLTSWREKQLKEEMDKLVNFWQDDKIPPCTCPSWMKDYNSFQPICGATTIEVTKYLKLLEDGKKLLSNKKSLYVIEEEKRKELKNI